MLKFFSKKRKVMFSPKTPKNTCIYAIGDIHGCADLLKKMHETILEDAKNTTAEKKVLVFLGDYIDRGLHTKEVLEYLTTEKFEGFKTVFLKGNHEWAMLRFLEEPERMQQWTHWGGDATIYSYGVNVAKYDTKELAERFREAFPKAHLDFCKKLKLSHIEGDYLFVHAGIRPSVKIEKQDEDDMLRIRHAFFDSVIQLEKAVVFGHTMFDKPFYENHRIGIDTGACMTGELTAVKLEDETVEFISVKL